MVGIQSRKSYSYELRTSKDYMKCKKTNSMLMKKWGIKSKKLYTSIVYFNNLFGSSKENQQKLNSLQI